MTRRIILLGPQPEFQSLRDALALIEPEGQVAMITAGWEEDEDQDQALRAAIQQSGSVRAVNLRLFARTEQLFTEDPEFIHLLRRRQDELRELREVYNLRLDLLLAAARGCLSCESAAVELAPECESAIQMVRTLDREYLERTTEVCDRYDTMMHVDERPLLTAHRQELADALAQYAALVISGGHAAIILNRLKIFRMLDHRDDLPVIAWSGGAMALSRQIVLFHDSPPQGPGNPEVLRAGIGVFEDVLPLPNARKRLKLDDQTRVSLFARRFSQHKCVALDERTILDHHDGRWHCHGEPQQLGAAGNLTMACDD